jgi:hypothetical protein
LYTRGHRNFLVIKASRGGGGNSFWLKGSKDDHMYRHVIATVRSCVASLPKGQAYNLRAIFYVQGESDGSGEAKLAGERLNVLADNLRADLPKAKDARFIIGEIAAAGARRDLVRKNQRAFVEQDPLASYVATLDMQSQLYDRLHFNKSAKLELGRRFAAAWLKFGTTRSPTQ